MLDIQTANMYKFLFLNGGASRGFSIQKTILHEIVFKVEGSEFRLG